LLSTITLPLFGEAIDDVVETRRLPDGSRELASGFLLGMAAKDKAVSSGWDARLLLGCDVAT